MNYRSSKYVEYRITYIYIVYKSPIQNVFSVIFKAHIEKLKEKKKCSLIQDSFCKDLSKFNINFPPNFISSISGYQKTMQD